MLKAKSAFTKILVTAAVSTALISGCTSTSTHESTGQFLDSSAVTTKIKAQFLADSELRSLPITVKTYKGEIQLSGFVDNAGQKARAVALATHTAGNLIIKDALIIKTH